MSVSDLGTHCDTCGCWFSWFEFAETIEEYLCEHCASGVGPDGEEWPDDGMEEGFDSEQAAHRDEVGPSEN